MIEVFFAAFVIMLASLAGAFFVWRSAGHWLEKNSRYLVTFSAGVFIIVAYGLFTESRELGGNNILLALTAALGALFLEIIGRFMQETHHHHGTDHDHDHSPTDARRLIIGDAIHNVIDGIVLVPAFLIDIRVGIATTVAIFFHEAVQEISEFFVLKGAGYSTLSALSLNFLVSSTILIGVFLGSFISADSAILPFLIAFAAGAFLYVVFRDLLPSTVRDIVRKRHSGKHLVAGVLGILVMFGVGILLPEEPAIPIDEATTQELL